MLSLGKSYLLPMDFEKRASAVSKVMTRKKFEVCQLRSAVNFISPLRVCTNEQWSTNSRLVAFQLYWACHIQWEHLQACLFRNKASAHLWVAVFLRFLDAEPHSITLTHHVTLATSWRNLVKNPQLLISFWAPKRINAIEPSRAYYRVFMATDTAAIADAKNGMSGNSYTHTNYPQITSKFPSFPFPGTSGPPPSASNIINLG